MEKNINNIADLQELYLAISIKESGQRDAFMILSIDDLHLTERWIQIWLASSRHYQVKGWLNRIHLPLLDKEVYQDLQSGKHDLRSKIVATREFTTWTLNRINEAEIPE